MSDVGLAVFNQYSTVRPLLRGMPQWVKGVDAERIASYSTYEQIYWSIPEAFKLIQRGSDERPIYLPAPAVVVETAHRYLCKDIKLVSDPTLGSDSERTAADVVLASLLRRERWYSRFSAAKRYGLIQGDWILHIYADPSKPLGTRISVVWVDPASYFPIHNDDNEDEIIGAHLVELIDEEGKSRIRRLTYRKASVQGGPSPIVVSDEIYEVDKWGGPGLEQGRPVRVLRAAQQLPDPIRQVPLYHIRNLEQPGGTWGSSELRGVENLMANMNQAISDADLALVLDGIGVYATNAGTPMDEDGNDTTWDVGPGRVVELPGGPDTFFKRVNGVGSITPYQQHIDKLETWLNRSRSISDIAAGKVDVAVAESGIALLLEMGPTLSRSEEKETIVTDVLVNWLYDLRNWLTAYEGVSLPNGAWIPAYGDKLPENRKQKFEELMALLQATPPVVSTSWVRSELRKLGYDISDDTAMAAEILQEQLNQVDVMGARLDRELAAVGNGQVPPVVPPGAGA